MTVAILPTRRASHEPHERPEFRRLQHAIWMRYLEILVERAAARLAHGADR